MGEAVDMGPENQKASSAASYLWKLFFTSVRFSVASIRALLKVEAAFSCATFFPPGHNAHSSGPGLFIDLASFFSNYSNH